MLDRLPAESKATGMCEGIVLGAFTLYMGGKGW
jgi:hypothetical protein